ncbi:type ISP restriction/modification enzyme [Rhodopseudomonas palustris]|uniref:site-specific DNA-methyltransferase (adenine-specific) n=1 Tax=Rhodopseudomonas palustris (strain ATCC BAA-98 / CGA009) TaxID=258594 RepID=A0AAE9Y2E9_RHOPA|nr:type ISP restriction/modification enzyme [Rhodopseudomonas palustris]RJF65056.1 DNA methyltransferase [Rhodopseudomonas palustris]WAB76278.1 N-6 DNA methylase [Rhodopseudomonas palustris]WCL93543.1 N-6 DNA methylase [Rhodopseudomonas palustris CGA009]WND50188.1 N-6 DNA methylase [Rhodopseudomonas palustris]
MAAKSVESAVAEFGAATKSKLSNPAVSGAPEDQLRAPLERLLHALAELGGLPPTALGLVGETALGDLKIRPDYAVTLHNALIGFIELKAPGKGADPRRFSDPHDKAQWDKLKSLPNLLYTDGNSFSLWRDGVLIDKPVHLDGDVETAGAKLTAPATLAPLIATFLQWSPIAPKSAKALAQVSARLCRLLRDEVIEQLELGSAGLTELAKDWRHLLFPQADNAQFADGYAQAVTFGLLVARAKDISLIKGIDAAAQELRKSNTLIGTALRLLTDDDDNQQALKTSLGTLTRVLGEVNWHVISKDKPEAWLYFYEDFLEVYDNTLRKKTGSYYTPPEVVAAMVRLADEALRGELFGRPKGFASPDVTVADPAVGTGTFLLGVLRKIAETVKDDEGAGAVRGAIEAAAKRLFGFELQFGPFAVAQLRLIAEMQALVATKTNPLPDIPELNLFITDTLGNPFVEEESLGQVYEPIAKSRREANAVKKDKPITVVIGNPPYKEKAKGRGGWIESGSGGDLVAPMDRWKPPKEWGVGTHAKHLKNLYVYFWRWATWKVFGSGNYAATGFPDKDQEGIVCFITVAGFLNGPGFEKMRADLRESCSDIWVVDCSPDGHQPEVSTRIFQGVQQPVSIVLAARKLGKAASEPARVKFRALPKGRREDKFAALSLIALADDAWLDCPSDGRAPFMPAAVGFWSTLPKIQELFLYDGSGVMPGRTWIIAPDRTSLASRWDRLVSEKDPAKKELLFHPHEGGDKTSSKPTSKGLYGHAFHSASVNADPTLVTPIAYAFRSFNRQWIIPDNRVINRPNPTLWNCYSLRQLFLTALEAKSPISGPALTFTGLIPDLDHYNGRGGRVFPLWADSNATDSNIKPVLLAFLAERFGKAVKAEDVMSYIAALMAHPAFTARFAADLVQPGLRLPITADAALFDEAVRLGREVIWLHCYGERFADPAAGRPKQAPRLPKASAPRIPAEGAVPSAPEPLPDSISYDPATKRLRIGEGFVENVTPEMWAYEVSGKKVVWEWFSDRRRDRTKPIIADKRPPSPLDSIQPDGWLAEYTSDLLDLLNVLGRLIELEPAQADLLDRVCASHLFSRDDLIVAGALGA